MDSDFQEKATFFVIFYTVDLCFFHFLFLNRCVSDLLSCTNFKRCFSSINLLQITERKSELAKLEALDCGKPLDEAAWDIVYQLIFTINIFVHGLNTSDPKVFHISPRMMLLAALSTMRILEKPWMQSRGLLSLFLWKHLSPMFFGNLLE